MDNKGSVLLSGLTFMLFVTSFMTVFIKSSNYYLKVLQDYQDVYDRLELEKKIIDRINKEFYEFENKNFYLSLNDCDIEVTYNDLTAFIEVKGKHNFTSCLWYNDEYGTINEYQYNTTCD